MSSMFSSPLHPPVDQSTNQRLTPVLKCSQKKDSRWHWGGQLSVPRKQFESCTAMDVRMWMIVRCKLCVDNHSLQPGGHPSCQVSAPDASHTWTRMPSGLFVTTISSPYHDARWQSWMTRCQVEITSLQFSGQAISSEDFRKQACWLCIHHRTPSVCESVRVRWFQVTPTAYATCSPDSVRSKTNDWK